VQPGHCWARPAGERCGAGREKQATGLGVCAGEREGEGKGKRKKFPFLLERDFEKDFY
jgi:hypothetical protein